MRFKNSLMPSIAVMVSFGVVGWLQPVLSFSNEVKPQPAQKCLADWLSNPSFPPRIRVGGEELRQPALILKFYDKRFYEPAWQNEQGIQPPAFQLFQALQGADQHGLRPEEYHLYQIQALLSQSPLANPNREAALDLLLTDAFFLLAQHLSMGRADPTVNGLVGSKRSEPDFILLLQEALPVNRIAEALRELAPNHPEYDWLKSELARYRALSNEAWEPIKADPPLTKGLVDKERVPQIRFRLKVLSGIDSEFPLVEGSFDADLENELKKFQSRMGLPADGQLSAATWAELNLPLEKRIRTIELNLERWRWLPRSLGPRRIMVNIPDYRLTVLEQQRVISMMRAVVGQRYRRTPLLIHAVRYIVFNPQWEIPPNIVVQDKLSKIRNDPEYFTTQRIKIFQGWGETEQEVDPKTVDWKTIPVDDFYKRYRLRQAPGPGNPLGRIKFMFPNEFNVYLHDTSSPQLFEENTRLLSSGCIRIEKPVDLAAQVLRGDGFWTRRRIEEAIQTPIEKKIRLPKPFPVYILYWTAWRDTDGRMNFRPDVYGLDAALDNAMYASPPIELPIEKDLPINP